jgi:hypothetical protein
MGNPFDTKPPYGMEFLQGNLSAPVLVFATQSEAEEARPNIRGFFCVSPLNGYTFLQTDWAGSIAGRRAIAVGSQAFTDRAANVLERICRPLHVTTGDVAQAQAPDSYRVRFKRRSEAEPGFPFEETDTIAGMSSSERDDELFPSLHGHSNSLAIVDALTKSCVTHYGHAGPAFVQWLIDHQDEAPDRLEKLLDVWNASCASLVEGAHAQAHRVMSRLGSIAIGAALAADVLGFDWDCCTSPEINEAAGEHLGKAGRSMMWAYRDLLSKWLAQNGVDKASKASTQILEGVEELKSYFVGFPAHFPTARVVNAQAAQIVTGQSLDAVEGMTKVEGLDPHKRVGFRTMSAPSPGFDNGVLEYVDFLPGPLMRELGWTSVTQRAVFVHLRERGFLKVNKPDELKSRRTIGGQSYSVYRVEGAFFSYD